MGILGNEAADGWRRRKLEPRKVDIRGKKASDISCHLCSAAVYREVLYIVNLLVTIYTKGIVE